MTWLVSFPVWGDYNRQVFCSRALRAMRYALDALDARDSLQIVFHTDIPGFIGEELRGYNVIWRQAFTNYSQAFHGYRDAHLDVLNNMAAEGDLVSCLNADFFVSGNFFTRLREHAAAGKRAVTALGLRTLINGEPPPEGMPPRALLAWGWENRHQCMRDHEWGTGSGDTPTNIFWTDGKSALGHAWHLHPVLVVREGHTTFQDSIDSQTLASYDRDRIHVVEDPDDLAFVEMSPPWKKLDLLPSGMYMNAASAARVLHAQQRDPGGLYRWQLRHRILLVGDGAGITTDLEVVEAIIAEVNALEAQP